MQRQQMTFADFQRQFIERPDGYFPVHTSLDEDNNGDQQKILCIDLICEWRLTDGKVLFLSVSFDTQAQFEEIRAYLVTAADLLQQAIRRNVGSLQYPRGTP